MYVRVPEHLKTPLLAELKQLKLRSSLKYFPVLVLIFSAIVVLIVLVKGFGLLRMLSEYTNLDISSTKFIIISRRCTLPIRTYALRWLHYGRQIPVFELDRVDPGRAHLDGVGCQFV